MVRESGSGTLNDYQYTSVRDHGLPLVRAILDGIFKANNLDAIVYPTASRRPQRIDAPPRSAGRRRDERQQSRQPVGFPDLIVPAGFSTDDLPIGISFIGPAFSESRLLAIGFASSRRRKRAACPCTRRCALATRSPCPKTLRP